MEIEIVRNNKNLLAQVVKLGTKNSKTLGHFPEGAYIEHALRGNLTCAFKEDKLYGYVLFSVTQSKRFFEYYSTSNKAVGIVLEKAKKFKTKTPLKNVREHFPSFTPPQTFKYYNRNIISISPEKSKIPPTTRALLQSVRK